MISIQSAIRLSIPILSVPAMVVLHLVIGISILCASDDPIAAAILGVISPCSESAITMPIAPMIIFDLRDATITGFSPVAIASGALESIELVANELVPIASTKIFGNSFFILLIRVLPRDPPCPSITVIVYS